MSDGFVPFDDTRRVVEAALDEVGLAAIPNRIERIYLVRDLYGKLRLSVSDALEEDEECQRALRRLAGFLKEALGKRSYPPENGLLFVSDALLNTLETARQIRPRIYLADRLMTGRGWWTVGASRTDAAAARVTLYSVKGGVGRSTTAAVLAWHLARNGERVLVVDLDLESPGLSSAMLEPQRRPRFGVTDWFVEDLVDQGDRAIDDMLAAPAWAQDFDGDVRVVPAHGADPGEYLAKLGRVYMDSVNDPWTARLERLSNGLEAAFEPTVTLLESRNGLDDIAAAAVTDLDADVLLFAVDSESTWTDYRVLFRHWNAQGCAGGLRERLSIVSALTPVPDRESYLDQFRSRAWDLFRDHLYDEVCAAGGSGDEFSFDLNERGAPHDPLEIAWTLGFSTGASLRNLDSATVNSAYGRFLRSFEERLSVSRSGRTHRDWQG